MVLLHARLAGDGVALRHQHVPYMYTKVAYCLQEIWLGDVCNEGPHTFAKSLQHSLACLNSALRISRGRSAPWDQGQWVWGQR